MAQVARAFVKIARAWRLQLGIHYARLSVRVGIWRSIHETHKDGSPFPAKLQAHPVSAQGLGPAESKRVPDLGVASTVVADDRLEQGHGGRKTRCARFGHSRFCVTPRHTACPNA